jgi:hypothetical protein
MPHTLVTAVTDRPSRMRETPFVNMVRRVCKKTLLEPGDTRQQWKGEAAASFVCTGITSSRALPTSSAGYWSPSYLVIATSASREKRSFGGEFLCRNQSSHSISDTQCRGMQALLFGSQRIRWDLSPPFRGRRPFLRRGCCGTRRGEGESPVCQRSARLNSSKSPRSSIVFQFTNVCRSGLFCSQGVHWVGRGGSSGRDVTGNQCHSNHHESNNCKGHGIGRTDVEDQAL